MVARTRKTDQAPRVATKSARPPKKRAAATEEVAELPVVVTPVARVADPALIARARSAQLTRDGIADSLGSRLRISSPRWSRRSTRAT